MLDRLSCKEFAMVNTPEQIEALGGDFVSLWREFSVFPTREKFLKKSASTNRAPWPISIARAEAPMAV